MSWNNVFPKNRSGTVTNRHEPLLTGKTMHYKFIKTLSIPLILIGIFLCFSCNSSSDITQGEDIPDPDVKPTPTATYWLTKADGSIKFKEQETPLYFNNKVNTYPAITIDPGNTYQEIDGFGYSLTGGSAQVIQNLDPGIKTALLHELFDTDGDHIGVSYLRISIGASDLDEEPFSYNDLPEGSTDQPLEHFSIERDRTTLIPLLKEILSINPEIRIMGSPWSPPVWMKDNKSTIGGSLLPEYYEVYARYFVKYIQAMADEGIHIDAITPQNEPLHPGNNPSMYMPAIDQSAFIKNYLGPAFEAAGIDTKIIIYDHNCDKPEYPISILNDADTRKYIDGSAFHLYGGNISALSTVHSAHPDKNLYFTEQWTSGNGEFGTDLVWHIDNVIIGSMRNWSKIALEWNLANDQHFGPHTDGGCTLCKGAITVMSPSVITKNVSYYIIAHASKFVVPGSVRLGSSGPSGLKNVAFRTPDDHYVLLVLNTTGQEQLFNIKVGDRWCIAQLAANDVATFTWK